VLDRSICSRQDGIRHCECSNPRRAIGGGRDGGLRHWRSRRGGCFVSLRRGAGFATATTTVALTAAATATHGDCGKQCRPNKFCYQNNPSREKVLLAHEEMVRRLATPADGKFHTLIQEGDGQPAPVAAWAETKAVKRCGQPAGAQPPWRWRHSSCNGKLRQLVAPERG